MKRTQKKFERDPRKKFIEFDFLFLFFIFASETLRCAKARNYEQSSCFKLLFAQRYAQLK